CAEAIRRANSNVVSSSLRSVRIPPIGESSNRGSAHAGTPNNPNALQEEAVMSPGEGKYQEYTIELVPLTGAVPAKLSVSKRPATSGPGDRVRWSNKDARGHTLIFTVWPFVEPPESIAIDAGDTTPWYTVYPGTTNREYDY